MSNDMKVYIDSKLLYVKDDKAYFEISIDGRVGNDLVAVDLNQFKRQLENI